MNATRNAPESIKQAAIEMVASKLASLESTLLGAAMVGAPSAVIGGLVAEPGDRANAAARAALMGGAAGATFGGLGPVASSMAAKNIGGHITDLTNMVHAGARGVGHELGSGLGEGAGAALGKLVGA
jgi:hypothetical protein